jgi:hypothetical protein
MRSLAERFWRKVARRGSADCWVWTGALHRHGYGQFENRQAARIAWELAIGPIAQGLEIGHTCGLRRCCNPAHLEAVTHLESQLRSPTTFASINAAKTRCPVGHPYDHTTANGWRRCGACQRHREQARPGGCSPPPPRPFSVARTEAIRPGGLGRSFSFWPPQSPTPNAALRNPSSDQLR